MAKAVGRTHNDYARSLNIRRRESGHLWQNRFHSCPVQPCYLGAVVAYVERNPVRAGMVASSEEWRWSSARMHLEPSSGNPWISLREWALLWTPDLWRTALAEGLAEAEIKGRLAEATQTGRPLGEDGFTASCERHSGLILRKQSQDRKQSRRKPLERSSRLCLAAGSESSEIW